MLTHVNSLDCKFNTNWSEDRTSIRTQINSTQKAIKHCLCDIKDQAAENLANTISSTDELRCMFEAVCILTNNKLSHPLIVHNDEGHVIGSDVDTADAINCWFETQFTGNEPALTPFCSPVRSLNTPITTKEVSNALSKLKNNRVCGPDCIPNELLNMLVNLLLIIMLISLMSVLGQIRTLILLVKAF